MTFPNSMYLLMGAILLGGLLYTIVTILIATFTSHTSISEAVQCAVDKYRRRND
jgi:hypothetical protein